MYHGLAAYNKTELTVKALSERIDNVLTEQCCFADKLIGKIGVFVDPDNSDSIEGYNADCYSCYKEGYGRYTNQADSIEKLSGETNYQYYKRVSSLVDQDSKVFSKTYAEFFVFTRQIDAIVVDKRYEKDLIDVAKKLAKKYKVEVITLI